MNRSIRLSPAHGVNPSLDVCFFCMKPRGVALFGMMRGDREAPREVCMDHEPCDTCKKWMEQGVVLISVDEKKTEDKQNPYRSGGFCVVKEDFIRRAVVPQELAEDICKKRVAFIPDDAWDALGLPKESTLQ